MWQMDQLPEWLDMGDEQDFVTPSVSLAEQLKKKMGSKGQGGAGSAMAGALGSEMPMKAASGAAGGMKSL